ncbi:uncharacterized protein [Blastocystis hominis]|uniref:Ubiquitin-like domain-containing protein n=1 Tax=Blastocystis hominis TaxID=12968 RepID=D8M6D8_BLAHO|nr:uncharacterized protein [Blastocystis hominis]CBK23691.2 unnamed protein product [Blastocystis hominis]|eukprot:XP_012897739.1 uncharacterized protein [Blastocystis hominis]
MNSLEDPWELGKRVIIDLFRLSDNGDICEPLRIERRWWDTVAAIRNEVSQSTGIPHELIDIIYEGRKLPLNYSLYQLAVNKNYIKLYFYCRSTIVGSESWIQVVSTVPVLSSFREALYDVRNAFSVGIIPELALYGTGGTYFLKDRYKWNLLVFKPEDEEPFAEHNPRNFQGVTGQSGFRKGIRSGEGWKREVAAYLIDHGHIFAVPSTVQAHVCHPFFTQRHPKLRFKVGSLQEFVQDADLVSDWSPSKFSAFEVQKIAFLDMYLMNTDRNDANIMVCKKRQITADDAFLLIPIDHGYTMPDRYELNEWSWCWLDWKQMKRPWDNRIVEYAAQLNVQEDVRLLNESLGIRKICLILFRISGLVLKIGIQHGLVPYDIASMYIRRDSSPDAPCALEKLVQECVEKLHVLELLQKMGKTQENVLSRSLSTRLVDEAEESEESEEEKAERKRSGSISQRNLSFQSMASIGYSKEPYRFPEDVEFKLVHDKEYRQMFFNLLEEGLAFWMVNVMHKRVYDAGIFV